MQIQINKSPPPMMLLPMQASDVTAGSLLFSLTTVALDVESDTKTEKSLVDNDQDLTTLLSNLWLPLNQDLKEPGLVLAEENLPALDLASIARDAGGVMDEEVASGRQNAASGRQDAGIIIKPRSISVGQEAAGIDQRDADVRPQDVGFWLQDMDIKQQDIALEQQDTNMGQKRVGIKLLSRDIGQPTIAVEQQDIAIRLPDTDIGQQNANTKPAILPDDTQPITNPIDSSPSRLAANPSQSTQSNDRTPTDMLLRTSIDNTVLQQPKNQEKNPEIVNNDDNQSLAFPDIMSNKMMVMNTTSDGTYQRVAPTTFSVIAESLASYQAIDVIPQPSDAAMDIDLATYHAKLNLFQPELGQVTADIAVTAHHTDITFTTERAEVTQIIESSLRQLRETFEQTDLTLTQVTIQNNLAQDKQELYKKFAGKEDEQKALTSLKPVTQDGLSHCRGTDWLVDTYA